MGVLPRPVKPLGIRDLDEGDLRAWNLAAVFGVYEFRASGGCDSGLIEGSMAEFWARLGSREAPIMEVGP